MEVILRYLKRVTRKHAPIIHNVSNLIRHVLFLARPHGTAKLVGFFRSRKQSANVQVRREV
jgi:hypothetical protein